MSIQNGKFGLTLYRITERKIETDLALIEAARLHAAPEISHAASLTDGVTCGWAAGRVLLQHEIDEGNSLIDGAVALHYRSTARKIDSGLLKATIQREIEAYKKANHADFVPARAKKVIREFAVSRLQPKGALAVRGIEVVIHGELVMIGSTSAKDCDLAVRELLRLGLTVEPYHKVAGFDSGRDFLTWLFRETNWDSTKDLGRIEVLVEGPLELVAPDEAQCTMANLKGELVTRSNELHQMVANEKKLIRKAKLAVTHGDDIWSFSFDADDWSFAGLELPRECDDFADRLEAVAELAGHLETLFNIYLEK